MDYFGAYRDVWNFHKKYGQPKLDDKYWRQLVDEADRIAGKYDNCEFVENLLLVIVKEIEKVSKEGGSSGRA